MSQRSKQIVARVLIVIFTLYYANICFFYHSHIINGTTIVHSHFHDNAHTQAGTHSTSELTLISFLSAFLTFEATFCFVALGIFSFLLAIILPSSESRNARSLVSCVSLRGPPSLI